MDNPRWLRVITVGLVLAALAVGYYILTGAFSVNKTSSKTQANNVASITPSVDRQPVAVNTPVPSNSPANNTDSAYNTIVARNQAQIQTLPNTGFPTELVMILLSSVIIGGLALQKFPH